MSKPMTGRPLTGRKVLAIAVGAFSVIIAANIALAVAAVGTFPGLEVKNGYIASQTFEAERAAQAELGWVAEAVYEDGELQIDLLDRDGRPLPVESLITRVGRPTGLNLAERSVKTRPRDGIPPESAGRPLHAPRVPLQARLSHLERRGAAPDPRSGPAARDRAP